MPLKIQQGDSSESFVYNANHERVRRTSVENGQTTTTVYINPRIDVGGTFERTYLPNGSMENTHYIYAGGDLIGSYISNTKGTAPTADLGTAYQAGVVPDSTLAAISKTGPYRYFHSDHLSSIEAITDSTGAVIERLSYDPWGKRRNINGSESETDIQGNKSSHGFTSHEMLDNIGLVHMNGRLYDPEIGRFISADPNIDGVDNLQGYNRYAYVRNNPGTLVDPSGYGWFSKALKSFGGFVADAFTTVADDWLGTCSKKAGDCGITVGATYGNEINNSNTYGSGSAGGQSVQPFIGFGSANKNYTFNYMYTNGDLTLNTIGVPINGYESPFYFNIKWASNLQNYVMAFSPEYMMDPRTIKRDQDSENEVKDRDWEIGFLVDTVALSAGGVTKMSGVTYTARASTPWYMGVGKLLSRLWQAVRGGCGCFDDDTPVLTKDGYKRIIDIQVGDLVLARNEEDGEVAYKPVSRVFVVPNRRIYLLTIEDVQGKQTVIEVSDDHPFWVVGKKWVESIDLKSGDELLDANNQLLKFVSLVETDRVETTYNLEVEGYHTYFAGDANVWVHNAKGPCREWNLEGTYGENSLTKHFEKHGANVGAVDEAQYLRKAQGFSQNLNRAEGGKIIEGAVPGVQRWYKNDKFIDIAPNNTIVSFGKRGYEN